MRYNTRHAPGWGRPTLSRTPPRRGHDKYKRRGIIGECYNISEG